MGINRLTLRSAATVAATLATTALFGCAPKYQDLKAFVQAHEPEVAATEYRLQPPDVIAISSPTAPEVDGEIQQLRSDGKLSLKLLGEVHGANMTPRELASKLEELLGRYYVSPSVSVRVVSFESKKIYVFGQVSRPGTLPFTGRDSVLDVLAQAQPDPAAWGSQVKVIRPSATPKERREIVVDIDRMMQTGDLRENVLLQEGDIVYIPPSPLACVSLGMVRWLFPFQQAATAYSLPANFIGANEYYKNHDSGQTYIRLSPGSSAGPGY